MPTDAYPGLGSFENVEFRQSLAILSSNDAARVSSAAAACLTFHVALLADYETALS